MHIERQMVNAMCITSTKASCVAGVMAVVDNIIIEIQNIEMHILPIMPV